MLNLLIGKILSRAAATFLWEAKGLWPKRLFEAARSFVNMLSGIFAPDATAAVSSGLNFPTSCNSFECLVTLSAKFWPFWSITFEIKLACVFSSFPDMWSRIFVIFFACFLSASECFLLPSSLLSSFSDSLVLFVMFASWYFTTVFLSVPFLWGTMIVLLVSMHYVVRFPNPLATGSWGTWLCTMLLSIELEISEICKSKAPVFAQFMSKIIRTSFDGCKTVKRSIEKYFLQILLKNVGFIGKKPEGGVR